MVASVQILTVLKSVRIFLSNNLWRSNISGVIQLKLAVYIILLFPQTHLSEWKYKWILFSSKSDICNKMCQQASLLCVLVLKWDFCVSSSFCFLVSPMFHGVPRFSWRWRDTCDIMFQQTSLLCILQFVSPNVAHTLTSASFHHPLFNRIL